MRIYVSHASAFDYKELLYSPLQNSSLSKQHQFILPHEHSANPEDFPTKHIIQNDLEAFIVEASLPATGSGIELGWADSAHVPILALHKEGTKLSRSVKMVATTAHSYKDLEEMLMHIEAFLQDL